MHDGPVILLPMPLLDRYIARELAQATLAAMVVLLLVSLGGVFADVLSKIASGRVPAGLMLSQFGLQLLNFLPLILPLGLMIGLMLGVGRLYRDSEMPVLVSAGVGPWRLLRPVSMVVLPVVLVVAGCSLWLGPWARGVSWQMIQEGNRNLLIAGLEAGRFVELPGGGGVVYVNAMSANGVEMRRVFIYREKDGRMDVTTAQTGELSVEGTGRYLGLGDGFRVEGPLDGGRDFRLMRYARNDVRLPDVESSNDRNAVERRPTLELLADETVESQAQLHARISPALMALAFALMSVPLARSPPRQARYGRIVMGFLAYVVGMNLMLLGSDWIAVGKVPQALGMWWLTAPLLGFGVWLYFADSRLRRGWRLFTRGRGV